jgi:hypothetical protein
MVYTLAQQVIRQDPGYYGVMAAARPDRNWRLICYPYYTKDTSAGERTGFARFDVKVGRLVDSGVGANLVQSAVSLDDEDIDNCSIVVAGIHRRLEEWYGRVRERGQGSNGCTTNASKIYTAVDQKEFGGLVGVPCRAGDVRISQPGILHGSSKLATRRRRVVFAWHCGIREGSPNPGHSGERDVGRALRVPPRSFDAGQERQRGGVSVWTGWGELPGGPVKLGSTSAIGDALVGGRRWTEAAVLAELSVVLGADGQAAVRHVQEVRGRLQEEFRRQFSMMVGAEMARYGSHSYFGGRSSGWSESSSSWSSTAGQDNEEETEVE